MKIIARAGFEITRELSPLPEPQRRVNIKHVVEWLQRRRKIFNFVVFSQSTRYNDHHELFRWGFSQPTYEDRCHGL